MIKIHYTHERHVTVKPIIMHDSCIIIKKSGEDSSPHFQHIPAFNQTNKPWQMMVQKTNEKASLIIPSCMATYNVFCLKVFDTKAMQARTQHFCVL